MTYCLAMRLNKGLVFLSDTRTNAGVDNVSTYRKLHVFRPAPDRIFVLQSAGNLATTQQVLDQIGVDLATAGEHESLATVEHLFTAALYLGELSRRTADQHHQALSAVGADGTASFLLGGQIGDDPPDILLVFPEGNYIRASDDLPFLQIGEAKYGKFLLDVAVHVHADLATGLKIALGSMMGTARANLSVGPPYDAGVYRVGSFELDECRFEAESEVLAELRSVWERHILATVSELPEISLPAMREGREPVIA
jgi:putative proteasome-type protease